jgi:hypothetical protein
LNDGDSPNGNKKNEDSHRSFVWTGRFGRTLGAFSWRSESFSLGFEARCDRDFMKRLPCGKSVVEPRRVEPHETETNLAGKKTSGQAFCE